MAVHPPRSKMLINRFWRAISLFLYPAPVTSFTGIRFTCAGIPRSLEESSRAQRSLSLTPLIMAYSKDIRRPVFLA